MDNQEINIPEGSRLTAALVEEFALRFETNEDEALEYLTYLEGELGIQEPQEAEDPGAGELPESGEMDVEIEEVEKEPEL